MAGRKTVRYDTLLFDWDGTVADSQEAIVAAFLATFEHFGEEAPEALHIRATIGMKLAEAVVRLCPRAAGSEQAWLEVYRHHSLRQEALRTRLFDGIVEVMDAARKQGMQIGIVSNKSQTGLEAVVSRFDLGARIDFVVGTLAGMPRKPDAAMFARQVQPLLRHAQGSRVLMIGDTAIDLQFARNAGLDSCWAGYGYGQWQECEALAPTHTAPQPADLLALFQTEAP